MVARVGGEEFAVAMLSATPREGELLAEKIRQGVEAQTFVWGPHKIN
jgi:GGDEF domain-containing protein